MARGKSIKKLLLDVSQAALFAGIEIHNKPNIAYRYPTATILNADIVAALCNEQNAVPLKRAICHTDDPNTPVMRVEPNLPPLGYAEFRQKVKEKNPDIKFGKTFNAIMKIIQANKIYCRSNYLDLKNKSGTKKDFYFVDAVDAVIVEYERMEADL